MKKIYFVLPFLFAPAFAAAGFADALGAIAGAAGAYTSATTKNPRSTEEVKIVSEYGGKKFTAIDLNSIVDREIDRADIKYYVLVTPAKKYSPSKYNIVFEVGGSDRKGFESAGKAEGGTEYNFQKDADNNGYENFRLILTDKEFKRGLDGGLNILLEGAKGDKEVYLPGFYVEAVLAQTDYDYLKKHSSKTSNANAYRDVVSASANFTPNNELIKKQNGTEVTENTFKTEFSTPPQALCALRFNVGWTVETLKYSGNNLFYLKQVKINEILNKEKTCDSVAFDIASDGQVSVKVTKDGKESEGVIRLDMTNRLNGQSVKGLMIFERNKNL